MSQFTPQNVFKGPDSVVQYYNPDLQPPLPMIELPENLNPFRADNVRIYAKMMTSLPAQNIKALPGIIQEYIFIELPLTCHHSVGDAPQSTHSSGKVDC